MSKFKVGDVLIDSYGDRCKVINILKDNPKYPYVVRGITGTYKGVWCIGANGEVSGTGIPGSCLDVTLDLYHVINEMWNNLDLIAKEE
jgi:hypothetical protein